MWETLQSIPPGQRNATLVAALADYQLGKKLESAMRKVLREELAQLDLHPAASPQTPAQDKPKKAVPQQAFDFLASL